MKVTMDEITLLTQAGVVEGFLMASNAPPEVINGFRMILANSELSQRIIEHKKEKKDAA